MINPSLGLDKASRDLRVLLGLPKPLLLVDAATHSDSPILWSMSLPAVCLSSYYYYCAGECLHCLDFMLA